MSSVRIQNVIVFLSLVIMAQTSFLSTQYVLLAFCLFLVVLTNVYRFKYDKTIFYFSVVWFVINLLTYFFLEIEFKTITNVNIFISTLLTPYLVLNFIGPVFWLKFESILFKLAAISLPLFLLNIIFPGFFDSLFVIFKPLTKDIYYLHDSESRYWTSLIYVNAIKEENYFRNSGFMWEPGAFAMVIILGMIINLYQNNQVFTLKNLVYAICLITTFSTAGYLAIAVFILALLVYNKVNIIKIAIACGFLVIFITYVSKLSFMEGEVNTYLEAYKEDYIVENSTYNAAKVNRFLVMKYDLIKVIKYPWGYGSANVEDFKYEDRIVGVNGFSNLLVMWGVLVFIYFMYLFYRYFVFLDKFNQRSIRLLLLISFSIMIFSNPGHRYQLIYFIFLTPLMFRKAKLV